jgi:aldehyde dehydrogenase (NAD+)
MSTPLFPNYINGEWVPGSSTFENRNPANTDEIVGLFSKGSAADVDAAAAAAAAAFPGWAGMPAPARGNILYKAAEILEKKFDQLGAEMTREEGKTLPEAKGEVRRAINIFRYFGGEGSRLDSQADWRGRPGHALEFPHSDPGMEDRSGAHLRQYAGREACVRFAALLLAYCGSAP